MDLDELLNRAAFDPIAEAERLSGQLTAWDEKLSALSATATSSDGLVEATVGTGGQLRDLVIDPRVFRTPDSYALAASILEAADAAAADVAEQVSHSTAGAFDLDVTSPSPDRAVPRLVNGPSSDGGA